MRIYHINFLFLLNDEDFIREVYRTVLGREPDDEGWQNYYSQLKLGGQRYDILYEISESEEAKKLKRSIPGLKEFKADYKAKRFGKLKKFYKYRRKAYSTLFSPDSIITSHLSKWHNQNLQSIKSDDIIATKTDTLNDQISFITQAIEGLQDSIKAICLRLDELEFSGSQFGCSVGTDSLLVQEQISQHSTKCPDDCSSESGNLIEQLFVASRLRFGVSIHSLMQLEGEDFLNEAYLAILHRELDDGGRDYFMSFLNQGTSKWDLLNMLIQTDEANQKPSKIEQLEEKIVFLSNAIHGLLSFLKNSEGRK